MAANDTRDGPDEIGGLQRAFNNCIRWAQQIN